MTSRPAWRGRGGVQPAGQASTTQPLNPAGNLLVPQVLTFYTPEPEPPPAAERVKGGRLPTLNPSAPKPPSPKPAAVRMGGG